MVDRFCCGIWARRGKGDAAGAAADIAAGKAIKAGIAEVFAGFGVR